MQITVPLDFCEKCECWPVLPTLFDEISPRDWFFVAKIASPKKRHIFNFCSFKNDPKSPIFPNKSSNFAKITHFFFGDFSKSNFVGDFCKKLVANLKPKIADLAKNRQSWQHWCWQNKIVFYRRTTRERRAEKLYLNWDFHHMEKWNKIQKKERFFL